MEPIQNLISILRANDWGIQVSGSWLDDESMMDTWAIIARDGSAVDAVNIPLPEKVIEVFARYLYECFDVDYRGITETWFPETATPCAAFEREKPIEAMTWEDVSRGWYGPPV